MSRATDPALHAPGFQMAHCLPAAGLKRPADLDLFRYNRVVPMYNSDPCIAPSDGQLICPPDCGYEKRNDLSCPAGIQNPESDSFQFYDTRRAAPEPKPACRCPYFKNDPPCSSLGPITDPLMCPCVNRPSNLDPTQGHVRSSHQPVTEHSYEILPQPAGIYDYYVNNRPIDINAVKKIPLCHITRDGAVAPTPHMMFGPENSSRGQRISREGMAWGPRKQNIVNIGGSGNCVSYHCQNPYFPSNYHCRPVFDRKYLDDCPDQNGPHPDHYTFL